MINLLRPAVLTALCLVLLSLGRAVAQDGAAFAEQLPDRVSAWLHVHDAATLRDRLAQCSWGRLSADPAMADFKADVLQKLSKVSSAIPIPDLLNEVSGELSVALMKPEDGKTEFAASVGFAGEDVLGRIVTSIIDRATADKKSVQDATHNSVAIRVITDKPTDPPDAAQQAFAVMGQRLIATNSLPLLREILDRWDGAPPGSFATNAQLQLIAKATREADRQPAAEWYLDLIGFMQGVLAGGQSPLAGRLESLEFDRLQGVGGTVDFATGSFDTISRTVGLVKTPVTGILGLLHFPADTLAIPAWVPDSVSGCLVVNWDADGGWLSLRALANELMGAGKFDAAVAAVANDPDGPMIHLGTDVLGQLTGRLVVVQNPPAPDSKTLKGEILLAADVKDSQTAQAVLDRLANLESERLTTKTVAGTKVVSYVTRAKKVLHLTLARDQLLVTESDELLQQVLAVDPPGGMLSSSAAYQRLSAHLPARSSVLGFQRNTEQLRTMYTLLQANEATSESAPNLKLLPAFQTIQRYFLPTATYATSTTLAPNVSGFQYVSFTLAPPVEAE